MLYEQISSNKRKTFLLIAVFIAFVIAVGFFFGEYTGDRYAGLTFAAIISLTMTLFSYFASDKIALATSGAKRIETKESNPYLWRMVENLCITAGAPMPRLYIIEDSAINAFATGRNPQHAAVAVTRGALEKLENEELEGVIAHELSHIKNYDILVMTVVVLLVGLIALLSDWLLRMHLWGGRDRDRGGGAGYLMIVGLILAILSPLIAELIKLAVSRKREYLADASGALLTRFPEGLAAALEKIGMESQTLRHANHATAHLYIANPFGKTTGFFERIFSTHPPLAERIALLRRM